MFLFVITATFLINDPAKLSASLINNNTQVDAITSISNGVDVLVDSGDGCLKEDLITCTDGAFLTRVVGMQFINVGDYRLTALDGSFYTSFRNGKLTVAALTAPVLVKSPAGSVLVPAYRQWKSSDDLLSVLEETGADKWFKDRELHTIPNRFLEEKLKSLSEFPDISYNEMLPSESDLSRVPSWIKLSVFRLPASRQSIEQSRMADQLVQLIEYSELSDTASVESSLNYN